MKCPLCSSDDAYTGLLFVHCRNKQCRHYDKKYDEKLHAERSFTVEPDTKTRPEERLRLIREWMDLNQGGLGP